TWRCPLASRPPGQRVSRKCARDPAPSSGNAPGGRDGRSPDRRATRYLDDRTAGRPDTPTNGAPPSARPAVGVVAAPAQVLADDGRAQVIELGRHHVAVDPPRHRLDEPGQAGVLAQ